MTPPVRGYLTGQDHNQPVRRVVPVTWAVGKDTVLMTNVVGRTSAHQQTERSSHHST